MYSFKCNQQQLVLHPDRVLFWEDESALILSDLHFGKTGHFRKSGIAVPQNVYKEDLQRLVSLIQYFNPRQLFIVGDLFHSKMNKELDLFKRWRNDFLSLAIKLIRGNHDILDRVWYKEAGIDIYEGSHTTGPFCFCHDPADCENDAVNPETYTFTGHIHPGINIYGLARQSLRFPCFYFTETYCVLPAFSRFTGTYSIRPLPDEKVFAIVDGSILKVG